MVPDDWTRKLVSLPRELARRVEDYRFAHRIKSEAGAIRILLEAGLNAESANQNRAAKESA